MTTTSISEEKTIAKAQAPRKVVGCTSLLLKATDRYKKEYGCTTTTEKVLAERIASAHIEVIACGEVFNTWLAAAERRSSPITGRELDALSRHIDRTHRQMLAALTTLRQIKQPQLQVNVIARNAFVAQNQQINAEQPKS